MEAKNDSKRMKSYDSLGRRRWVSGNEEQRKEVSTFYHNLGTAACAASRVLSLTNEIPTVLSIKTIHLYDGH